jgi:hypothetical protein
MSTLYAIAIGGTVFLVACWLVARAALNKFIPPEGIDE